MVAPAIVLTGFGPFPGVAANATATLVPRLAGAAREQFAGYDVVDEILPTEWRQAPTRLRALLGLGNIALMLHFGVAPEAHGFRLELVSRNIQAPRHDAAGELPASSRIVDDGPEMLTSTWPVERVAARLMSLGLPCATSDNAGSYLCNALLYLSLTAAHEQADPRLAGFVHLPANLVGHGPDGCESHPDCLLDMQSAVRGGLEIIATCLDHHAARAAAVNIG